MTSLAPIPFQWDGEAMVPKSGFQAKCDGQYVVGEVYTLAPHESRSQRSHNHYFACVNEAWLNLPETVAGQFPTSEHLRKFALCMTGYCTTKLTVAANNSEAAGLVALINSMSNFAIVSLDGCNVTTLLPDSQSLKAMGKERFQQSKDDVLDYLSAMIDAALSGQEAA